MSRRQRNFSRNRQGSTIAEFGTAFYVFCFLILIPVINLLGFAVVLSYSFLNASLVADATSQAVTMNRARQVLDESEKNLRADALAGLLKVSPARKAFKLEVVKSKVPGNQFLITSSYVSRPFIDLGTVPFIDQIPILGKETTLSFKMIRSIENFEQAQSP